MALYGLRWTNTIILNLFQWEADSIKKTSSMLIDQNK